MNLIELAKERGITAPYAKGFMAYDSVDGNIIVNAKKTAEMAMDAAILSANVGLPAELASFISPEVVKILVAPNNATRLAPEVKVGDFETEFYKFPVEEIVGGVQPYSDYDNAVSVDVNYNFPVRENFRFQAALKYGELESAKAGTAKINLASRKQAASAAVIKKASNAFYLYGVLGKRNYGLLNDPNLNDSQTPIPIDGKLTWESKTNANPGQSANIVFADIVKLVNYLSSNYGGHFDQNARMTLGISNNRFQYLSLANTFGVTALELIKKTYPNMEVVQIPELTTAAGDMLYLNVLKTVDNQNVAECNFAELYRLGALIRHESHFSQKASSATFGGVVKYPVCIATLTGI